MKNIKMTKERFPDFTKFSIQDLLKFHSQIISELRQRKVIRSKNIVGDLGESLAIDFYNATPGLPNLQAAQVGTQNIDANSKNGERYSIKTTTGKTTGVFYGLPPNNSSSEDVLPKFEYVIIVKMNSNYELIGIYEINWKQFIKFKHWHSRMNAWNLSLTRELIANSKKIFEVSPTPQT